MYKLLIIVLAVFLLFAMINRATTQENFTMPMHSNCYSTKESVVGTLSTPMGGVSNYYPSHCCKGSGPCLNGQYVYLPYDDIPYEGQAFCPPHILYNTSCYPRPLKDNAAHPRGSFEGPYTARNFQNAPATISSMYPIVKGRSSNSFSSREKLECNYDQRHKRRCLVKKN